MSEPLYVAPRPCNTCPYRRDTPAGIWHPDEYAKLPRYDPGPDVPELATFHCHQENATGRPSVCVGWLGCHGFEAPAIRLAVATDRLTVEDVERAGECGVELYSSGGEACAAGLAGVTEPSDEAVESMAKLLARRAGRP